MAEKERDSRFAGLSVAGIVCALVLAAVLGAAGYATFYLLAELPAREQAAREAAEAEAEAEAARAAEPDPRVASRLAELTLEQKVAQLFVVTPEQLTGVECAVQAGSTTRDAIDARPVGGLVYFAQNLEGPKQATELIRTTKNLTKDACGLPPLVCVAEEGGDFVQIASNEAFDVEGAPAAREIGEEDDASVAYERARKTGAYLKNLGFTCVLAPVADLSVSDRSFGEDPNAVAQLVAAEVKGFQDAGIASCPKHFPGTGAAEADSRNGRLYSQRTTKQMKKTELVPFAAAIEAGAPIIMCSNLTCLGISKTASGLPASYDAEVVALLREDLGFAGPIMTDALSEQGATGAVKADEEAIYALEAGCDLILMPTDFDAAYEGLIDAVESGRVSEARIDQSLSRIILTKDALGT